MKKLLLLAAALVLAVACSKPAESDPASNLKLNHETAILKYGETLELKVIGLPITETVVWSVPDDYAIYFNEDTEEVTAFAIGTGEVHATVMGKTLVCKVTVVKTFDNCVFKYPTVNFGADTTAVKTAAATQGFEYMENEFTKARDSVFLYYRNEKDITTDYTHNYEYSVQLTEKGEANGLFDIIVIVPTEVQADLDKFHTSFAERHYFVGNINDGAQFVYMDKAKTYSVICWPVKLNATLFGLVAEYINETDWQQGAPAMTRTIQPLQLIDAVDASTHSLGYRNFEMR